MLLEMQPAQHAFRAHTLVILDKLDVKSSLFHIFLVIRLHEIAARIPMNSRLYNAEAFDASHIFCDFDLPHRILVLSLAPYKSYRLFAAGSQPFLFFPDFNQVSFQRISPVRQARKTCHVQAFSY